MVDMNSPLSKQPVLRLHLTNIRGLGAIRLIQSLLPSMASQNGFIVEQIYVHAKKDIIDLSLFGDETKITVYRRYLPHSASRFLECTFFGNAFDGTSPLLVLGDLPLRIKGKQVVFLQNSLLLGQPSHGNRREYIKYWMLQSIFKWNLKYVDSFIVQTVSMKEQLITLYPNFKERVHVIPQPVPKWLIESNTQHAVSNYIHGKGLKLFYPAAFYPHKNHKLLADIDKDQMWPIEALTLTISNDLNPNTKVQWIHCTGTLAPSMVLNEYRVANALLFLSHTESYGFPLVEAMWIGLPIICPDMAYARNLCGDQAIYFSPHSVGSLHRAVNELNERLRVGWWPDWTGQLTAVPKDWTSVAVSIVKVSVLKH